MFGTDFFASQKQPEKVKSAESESKNKVQEDDVTALADELHDVSLDTSQWDSLPSHPAKYLATIDEVITTTTARAMSKEYTDDASVGGEVTGPELYENSLDTDPLFDRFTRRVSNEGEQCVR